MSGSSAGLSPMLLVGIALLVLLALGVVVFLLTRRKQTAPTALAAPTPAQPTPAQPAPAQPAPVRVEAATPASPPSPAAPPPVVTGGPVGEVFISFSSKDKPTADTICALLEREGIRCWIAPRDILPGQDWAGSVLRGISHARVFVLVFSAAANASPQVTREVERAVHNEIPIIPFRVEDVAPSESLEYFISTPHWLDAFTPPLEAHVQRLRDSIQSLRARASTT
jgi:hypothetical protein